MVDIAGSFNKAEVSGGDLKMTDKLVKAKVLLALVLIKKTLLQQLMVVTELMQAVEMMKYLVAVLIRRWGGNDIIDGGTDDEKKKTDGARIEECDRAQYKGKFEDFEMNKCYYRRNCQTLHRNRQKYGRWLDEGTDIVKNIEILEFSTGGGQNAKNVLLTTEKVTENFIDPDTGLKLKKKISRVPALMIS